MVIRTRNESNPLSLKRFIACVCALAVLFAEATFGARVGVIFMFSPQGSMKDETKTFAEEVPHVIQFLRFHALAGHDIEFAVTRMTEGARRGDTIVTPFTRSYERVQEGVARLTRTIADAAHPYPALIDALSYLETREKALFLFLVADSIPRNTCSTCTLTRFLRALDRTGVRIITLAGEGISARGVDRLEGISSRTGGRSYFIRYRFPLSFHDDRGGALYLEGKRAFYAHDEEVERAWRYKPFDEIGKQAVRFIPFGDIPLEDVPSALYDEVREVGDVLVPENNVGYIVKYYFARHPFCP